MGKLSDKAYRSKTLTMIQSFDAEQKDKVLLAQYCRNRRLEETVENLERLNSEQTKELKALRLRIHKLENRLKFSHIQSYRIRYETMNQLDPAYDYMVVDMDKVEELTAIVFYHKYDSKKQHLSFVDHEYVEHSIGGVTKMFPF